jgi:hypothetical protein
MSWRKHGDFIVISIVTWYSLTSKASRVQKGFLEKDVRLFKFFILHIIRYNFVSRNRKFPLPKGRRRRSDMAHQLLFFTCATVGNFTAQTALFAKQVQAVRRGEALLTQNKFLLLFYNYCYEGNSLSRHPFPLKRWYNLRSNSDLTVPRFPLYHVGSTGNIISISDRKFCYILPCEMYF